MIPILLFAQQQTQLSWQAWLMLTVILLLIFGGLSWCFYRAIRAARQDAQVQYPDEV